MLACFDITKFLNVKPVLLLAVRIDLDVEVLRSLEEALLDFAGCAMVVSHDRYFLDRVATHILACEGDSKWFFFPGNYAEYEANRLERLGETSIKRITYAPLVNA